MAYNKNDPLEKRVQDQLRRDKRAKQIKDVNPESSSPGTVFVPKEQVPTMKERKEAQERARLTEDDWQTSPDFDREKGGWQNRNALTIQNLFQQAHLGRSALRIAKDGWRLGSGLLSLLIGRPDSL